MLLLLSLCAPVSAAEQAPPLARCTLAWENPDPAPDLQRVRLYGWQEAGPYANSTRLQEVATSAPGATVETPCVFPAEGIWYVVARAVDAAGNESADSNTVTLTWDTTGLGPPTGFRLEETVTTTEQQTTTTRTRRSLAPQEP